MHQTLNGSTTKNQGRYKGPHCENKGSSDCEFTKVMRPIFETECFLLISEGFLDLIDFDTNYGRPERK